MAAQGTRKFAYGGILDDDFSICGFIGWLSDYGIQWFVCYLKQFETWSQYNSSRNCNTSFKVNTLCFLVSEFGACNSHM
ncbi:hypothetical protein UY3_06502 [Chelonia mydas]|uniref:Uncharacterized protein n=1 Tax=Chelonia mydas TaxID=8469 RepID=M7C6V5_CHEMY|nr:hypothetical protein UY3_06502 [Chelonia mydas]